jgi:hypothetical protein
MLAHVLKANTPYYCLTAKAATRAGQASQVGSFGKRGLCNYTSLTNVIPGGSGIPAVPAGTSIFLVLHNTLFSNAHHAANPWSKPSEIS